MNKAELAIMLGLLLLIYAGMEWQSLKEDIKEDKRKEEEKELLRKIIRVSLIVLILIVLKRGFYDYYKATITQ